MKIENKEVLDHSKLRNYEDRNYKENYKDRNYKEEKKKSMGKLWGFCTGKRARVSMTETNAKADK